MTAVSEEGGLSESEGGFFWVAPIFPLEKETGRKSQRDWRMATDGTFIYAVSEVQSLCMAGSFPFSCILKPFHFSHTAQFSNRYHYQILEHFSP